MAIIENRSFINYNIGMWNVVNGICFVSVKIKMRLKLKYEYRNVSNLLNFVC